MKVIAFTGMPASGKSEAVQLAKDKGIPVVRMGDLVWEETKRQGKPLDDKHVGAVANDMRKHHGMDVWAIRTVERIQSFKKSSMVVIDGVRNMEEIDYFKQVLGPDFLVVAIDAPDEVRRKRAISRGRTDDSKNLKDLEERDKREIRWGLQKVIADADIVIPNSGALDAFRKRVATVMQKVSETIP
ncbi:MAG TPA: AAA family ATPase [Candidatus Thermoplasmatota archaeon]|nr:AAA family ATPase [Candidatus Thermoplasmatota archaeon]